MITDETRTSIKKIYGMLWDVLALYEKTERYNRIPENEKETELDIWDFMRFLEMESFAIKWSR